MGIEGAEKSVEERKGGITMRRAFIRVASLFGIALLGFSILMIALLSSCQRRLIYFPHGYSADVMKYIPAEMVRLEYTTSAGEQTSFYWPPEVNPTAVPPALLIIFNGNGSAALDWLGFVDELERRDVGVFIIDYPGYGLCEGNPSRQSINTGADAAFAQLQAHLGADEKDFQKVFILGHSLGAATGLEFAVRHRADRIVLCSPFTTMRDMARKVVGWPLCYLLYDCYNNEKSLQTLSQRDDRPEVYIFHGTADPVVPVSMGRALGKKHPQWIHYEDVPNVDHVWIIEARKRKIHKMVEEL